MITHGSLLSGIGGFDLGFERHNIKTLWACEIDPHARRVLKHHWPDLDLRGDITELDPATLAPVDIISFGSPCQDLSIAGKRVGLGGERSGLFYEAIRIVRGVRPSIVVWENVPYALSINHGRDFGAILDALAECGALDIGWRVLDARWFGVAQRRRRLYVVADFRGRRAAEILALAESLRGHPAPGRTTREDTAHSLRASTAGRGSDDADRLTYVPDVAYAALHHAPRYDGESETFVAAPLTAGSHGNGVSAPGRRREDDVNLVTHALTAEGHDASEDGTGRGTPLVALGFYHTNRQPEHGNYEDVSPTVKVGSGTGAIPPAVAIAIRGRDGGATAELSDVPSALRASQGGSDKAHVLAFDERQVTSAANRSRVESGLPLPTLNNADGMRVAHPAPVGMVVRRLTPTECCRLQGFPDDHLHIDPPLADSAKYRLLGNAVCVAVSSWLGARLVAALGETTDD